MPHRPGGSKWTLSPPTASSGAGGPRVVIFVIALGLKNVVGVPPQLIEISLAVNSASGVFLFLGHSFSIWGLANRV